MSSSLLRNFIRELDEDKKLDLHTVLVVKDGAVVCRAAWGDYNFDVKRIAHSESKSVVSLAIGILIGDGKLSLSDRAADLLSDRVPPLGRAVHSGVTVENLLRMSSGKVFAEDGSVADDRWVESYFESAFKFIPGKAFDYNSMNSHILAAIVCKVSGMSLSDFLRERLFGPMGITNFYWEKSPEDIECGGWGLYMFPDDMAKLGVLVLNGGKWEGKSLVPEDYIKAAVSKQNAVPDGGGFDYGYHIWSGKTYNCFLFNGLFGQNVIGFPESGVVVVVNGAVGEFFQQSRFYGIACRYFGHRLPGSTRGRVGDYIKLQRALSSLKNKKRRFGGSLPSALERLDGKKYIMNGGKKSPVGLMPVLISGVRNSYTTGITEIGFRTVDGILFIDFTEDGAVVTLPVGLNGSAVTEITLRGEKFAAALSGTASENGDALNLRLSFLELSNARLLDFAFTEDGLDVRFSEIPEGSFILDAVGAKLDKSPVLKFFKDLGESVIGDAAREKAAEIFSPVLSGKEMKIHYLT